jgi:hypothetical protein
MKHKVLRSVRAGFLAAGCLTMAATNTLEKLCLASPAVAGDRLLIRTSSRLYCIGRQAGSVLRISIIMRRRCSRLVAGGTAPHLLFVS